MHSLYGFATWYFLDVVFSSAYERTYLAGAFNLHLHGGNEHDNKPVLRMSGYNDIPQYVSPQTSIRQAFGSLGYGDKYQSLKEDCMAWIADACDEISRLKIYTDVNFCGGNGDAPNEYVVCNNKIELPMAMKIVICASFNGCPMTYRQSSGCNRLCKGSVNRCCNSDQFFTLDECYMHFTPPIADGAIITVDGRGRLLDDDGYPMVPEVCILAVSRYVAAQVCLRYGDSRYQEFKKLWQKACLRARAELNQFSNIQTASLGYAYHKPPYRATYSVAGWGFGYGGGSLG